MSHARDVSKFVKFITDDYKVAEEFIDSDTLAVSSNKSLTASTGTKGYNTPADLPANAPAGTQGFVTSNNRLYISNGSGWYNIALINRTPYWITQPNGSYTLDKTGQSTVITILGGDSDGADVPQYTATGDSNFNAIATVTKDSDNGRVFIVSAIDSEGSASPTSGTGTLTFTLTDGKQSVLANSTFSIDFGPDWSASPTLSTLVASNGSNGDQFGVSVSINSDATYAIVGAPRYEGSAGYQDDYGSIYIYSRSGSTWTQQYLAGGTEIQEYLGNSVSISGDGSYAIAGAHGEDYINGVGGVWNSGRINIWVRSGSSWSSQAYIRAGDISADNYFGYKVDINNDGSYAIVGAHGVDTGGTNAGAAYIFTRSGTSWSQQQKLQSSDIQAGDLFGISVAISSDGTYAIVGAYEENGGTGAAYIFTRSGSTWTEQAKIVASDPNSNDKFGWSVSISNDNNYVIVGAVNDDEGGDNAGAAYVFTRSGSTWTQQAKLIASDSQANDWFGYSVAISGDTNHAIVGSPYEDTAGSSNNGPGASYIFSRSGSTWTEKRIVRSPTGLEKDFFGISVTMSSDGSYAIVGANEDDGGRVSNGTAHVIKAG
jgi:hypothetical protein